MSDLKSREVAAIVDAYCSRHDLPQSDDPADDLRRLAAIAASLPGAVLLKGELPATPAQPGFDGMLDYGAGLLYAINPAIDFASWRSIFAEILTARYGGDRLRIGTRPKLAKESDARHMTPRELMEKYGISRGHAYRLRHKALAKK